MINPLIISRLVEARIAVWIPLGGGNELVIQRESGEMVRCICKTTASDQESNPMVKISEEEQEHVITACDPHTRTVWLLPEGFASGRKIMRLGASCDEFILPEPRSLSNEEQKMSRKGRLEMLKQQARDMMGSR